MNCLRVVKEISEDKLLVYCNSCKSYFAMDKYEYNRNLQGGDIRSCKFCCRTSFGDYAPYYHQRYGTLRILAKLWADNSCYFVCKCDCGTYLKVESSYFSSGYAFSCGCFKRRRLIPEFTDKSEYTLTAEDVKNMDKLVCTLKSKTKVYKLADAEPKHEMTLKNLVAQYSMESIKVEDDIVSTEVQEESNMGIDTSESVEIENIEEESTNMGIEEKTELPWDSPEERTVEIPKSTSTEESPKCKEVAEEPADVVDKCTIGSTTFNFSVTVNSIYGKKRIEIRGNFTNVDEVINKAGFVTSKECDISSVAVFMNCFELDLDKMLSLHYTGEGDYFVKLDEHKRVSDVCMLSKDCLVVFRSKQSDGYLRLIGGLLC